MDRECAQRSAADTLSEVQVYAQALAAEGVPILVAAGDRWMLEDLGEGELGGARLVSAKEGQGRGRARSRDVEETSIWPELGLVVETDGLRYHRTASEQARDRRRDQAHVAAGLTQLRFTHWQVKNEPANVQRVLCQIAQRLRT